ncbi:MAG TPA: pyridoxine 5'-phosphate synthase [Gammaproteobacteria bacterium]|nr:pyridoxine 5'-phosphate synthase [Gammaproteobacteria bacterium]
MSDRARIALGVNIDHVASLRQARGTRYPEVLQAALLAEQAGAESITVHLREDRRHIQERDVRLLVQSVQTHLNLEMACTEEMLEVAASVRPADCCLVPERREELTTEGGLDVAGQEGRIAGACARLARAGIRVALFVDPDGRQLEACARTGAPVVELHTGRFADAPDRGGRAAMLEELRQAAARARALGLEVHAGHGLSYHNVQSVAAIPEVSELNIGHAIVARAVFTGIEAAVGEMRRLIREARAA